MADVTQAMSDYELTDIERGFTCCVAILLSLSTVMLILIIIMFTIIL